MSHLYFCVLLLVFPCTSAVNGCPASKHEVTSVPGYGTPPSRWVSGFIDAGLLSGKEEFGHMCFHYTYIESLGNPDLDPVVIWYQGGPGAPGTFGLFVEFGPLLLNADSLSGNYEATGMPEPVLNPFSWSHHANLLIMDNTPPIGFSYCSAVGPAANASQCGAWSDTSTIAANHRALTMFFNSVMPELRSHQIFLFGESYGGVFAPGIAGLLIDDPQGVTLKGLMVIGGCMGKDVLCTSIGGEVTKYPNVYKGPWWDVLFFHGHGQISNDLYVRIMSICPMNELKGETRPLSAPCQALIDEMFAVLGDYWPYNIFDTCDWSWLDGDLQSQAAVRYPFHPEGFACSSGANKLWLAREEVQSALGIPENSQFLIADNAKGLSYTQDVSDIRPMWVKALKAGLRVAAVTGDLDANVNMFALQDLFVDMWKDAGYVQTQTWRPWALDGTKETGGHLIEWAGGNASFVTFRGAGHMVPEYSAEASSAMFKNWIAGKDLPHFEHKLVRQRKSVQKTPAEQMVVIM